MSKLSRFIHFFTTDRRNNDGPTTGWLKRISTPAAVMNITDAVAKPVYDLVIAIEPVQSGSGNPSPSNVRPISGWTGVNVYRSGADTSSPTTFALSWQSEAGTVYGGTVDLTTGILTVKTKKVSVASVSGKWNVTNPNGSSFYVSISGSTHIVSADDIPALLSNELLYSTSPNNKMALYHFGGNSGGKAVWTIILPDTVADVAGANSWLASNPLEIIVQLETPVTYQLTPTDISMLRGENNIWADTGNVNSIAYYSTDETCSPIVGFGKVGSMSIA